MSGMAGSRIRSLCGIALLALVALGGLSCAEPRAREASGPEGCFGARQSRPRSQVDWRVCLFERGLATVDATMRPVVTTPSEVPDLPSCFAFGRYEAEPGAGSVRVIAEEGSCLDGRTMRFEPISCRPLDGQQMHCRVEGRPDEWLARRSGDVDDRLGDLAAEFYALGRHKSSLRYTLRSLRRDPKAVSPRDLTHLVATLRALERDLEAKAMSDYATAFLAGRPVNQERADLDLEECHHLMQHRKPTNLLFQRWGDFPRKKEFEVGSVVVRAEIDSQARLQNLEVLRAETPAAAQLVSQVVAGARISRKRIESRDVEDFPLWFCAYWDSRSFLREWDGNRNIRGFSPMPR